MNKILFYLKYIGILLLVLILIAILASLVNLTGLNNSLTSKTMNIINTINIFIVSSLASRKRSDKGYLIGLKLSFIFVILLIIINLIFFKSKISIPRFIYYTILIISGVLGGSFGKNVRLKKLAR